ncbi:MAG: histidine kinase N-terminal 7TM domain-containing protein [Muricomes sp.]
MFNLFILAIMLSVTVTALMMVYAIVKHTVEKSFFLILLSVANLFFVFGNLLEITAPTLETAFYGIRVQYMGGPFILPLTYLFFREFYGKKRFSSIKHAVFFVIPVLSMLALEAFPLVRLHYADIWYASNGYIASVQHTDGITYYLGTVLNYICIVLSLHLILERIINGSKRQRRQSLVLFAGWLAPLVANISFVFWGNDHSYDFTPIAYVTSMAVLLYSTLAHDMLDVLPLARAQVMDELEDAFVVCDEDFRFLDANLSARRLFPELATLAPGESMEDVRNFKKEGELRIMADGEEQHYKITTNPILT